MAKQNELLGLHSCIMDSRQQCCFFQVIYFINFWKHGAFKKKIIFVCFISLSCILYELFFQSALDFYVLIIQSLHNSMVDNWFLRWMTISRKNQSYLHCHSLLMEPAYFLVIGAICFFFGNLDILTFSHSGTVFFFWHKFLHMVDTCYFYYFLIQRMKEI